jgi:hypothetical protein
VRRLRFADCHFHGQPSVAKRPSVTT